MHNASPQRALPRRYLASTLPREPEAQKCILHVSLTAVTPYRHDDYVFLFSLLVVFDQRESAFIDMQVLTSAFPRGPYTQE